MGAKRDDYAALGILEYWRFDKTGEHYSTRLAGDRLVDGAYQPIPIDELDDGSLQGYSAALNLNLRWEQGRLGWYDRDTGQHIPTTGTSATGPTTSVSEPTRSVPAPIASMKPASLRKAASANWSGAFGTRIPDEVHGAVVKMVDYRAKTIVSHSWRSATPTVQDVSARDSHPGTAS